MTFFDIAVLTVVLISLAYSAYRGLVRELFTLAGLVLGYVVALNFQDEMAEALLDTLDSPTIAHVLAFFLLFTGTYLVVYFLGKVLKKYVEKSESISRMDRIWGGVVGAVKGVFIIVVALFPLQYLPETYADITNDSMFHPQLEELVEVLGDNVDVPKEYIEKLNETDLKSTMRETVDEVRELKDGIEETIENGKEKMGEAVEMKDKIQEVFTREDKEKLNKLLDTMSDEEK
ncbi:CvpA family protein [Nitrospina gracilis]|uniref:CvpA family protein n=1 Tax=Nitrospina gracilis TaxID=35801 RepID=UPI001F1E9630|nr:CvpA family protein [Nitrospina gracilis]MCF8720607.1 membrane protein required for colicin V production [Nitrospina gracilis Nb-211]